MEDKPTDKFYDNAKRYWEDIPPTVDGMLGGLSHISSTDIGGSAKFLKRFIRVIVIKHYLIIVYYNYS